MEYIQSQENFDSFCKDISNYTWLTIDTEFIRERTYYPKLCLIQIATVDHIACIDPFSIENLEALKLILYSSNVTKVFHAASQDLEVFYNLYGQVPAPIFDTQIAASALGYGDQISYAQAVKEICDVTLDKSLSRTNWDRRPLSSDEIHYALDDVKYLVEVYQQLNTHLDQMNRSSWVHEESMRICSHKRYEIMPDQQWKIVKGVGKLNAQQLNFLRELAKWREEYAMRENKPRRWIVRDKDLYLLAVEQPSTMGELTSIEGLTEESFTHANHLLESIENANAMPEAHWPNENITQALTRDQRKLLKLAQAIVREHAENLNISASLLATRSSLEKLVRGNRKLNFLHDWRKEIIGNDLLKLVDTDLL